MRILYIHNINQVARNYSHDLMQRGHYVEVYEPNLAGGSAPWPVKIALMPWRVLDMRRVVRRLNQKHFDIVHIHWASYGVLGLLCRIPFVVHCHGSDVRYRLQHPLFRTILRPFLRRAATVICITPDLLPRLRSIRPDIVFLPASIDTESFRPIEANQVSVLHPWTILLFTRLIPEKGLEISTQGIAQFALRHPEVRVRLIDWGSEKGKYKRRYGARFEFVPRVAPHLVQHLIASADVVVGQLFEGAIGFSELQAMSCSKPVIASFRYEDAYATPPPICQATTTEEIDEYLENLYQHPELVREIGQQAREWVIANHSRPMLATRLEDLYRSILTKKQELFGLT